MIQMMRPQCPHCMSWFESWPEAKKHVKYCRYGPNARKSLSSTILDCVFCGSRKFKDFAELSLHVRTKCPGGKGLEKYYRKEDLKMNIGSHIQEGAIGDYLPLLDPKLFKKLQKKGIVTGKMLACRSVNTPKFNGLAMDFKASNRKFSFLARFDRWDVTAIAKQLKSEETDDWIGGNLRFVAKKSSKGQVFVNVELPKRKKGKK